MAASRIAPAAPAEQGEAFLKHAEVRDVLAWMRLLVDPHDAAAVVRALSRPPIELRQVELARVIQVARRRTSLEATDKLDLVLGLAAATESRQVPPEARERIHRFVALHAQAAAELDGASPDAFLARLLELLRERTRPLLEDAAELAQQDAGLARLQRLADDYVRDTPLAGIRDLVLHLGAVVQDSRPQSPAVEPQAQLETVLELLREEVLEGVGRIGGRIGELRLDTDLDISHGVVRYLELLKVAALLQRPSGQSLADALADVNARLLAAATPLQREILQTSTLDRTLALDGNGAEPVDRAHARALTPREQHSLVPFLPRKGVGLALSASDIHTYRTCPLRYKYARVLRVPTEQTVHQRFGIVVHQVLERYHSEGGQSLEQMLRLLGVCWRRAGFPVREDGLDQELLEKARSALTRYHARLRSEDSRPVWFERQFHFRLGPHHLRGRVDRVDRLGDDGPPGGGSLTDVRDPEYELIDYKTSRPMSPEQLRDDIQLSLYALAAREDWGLESSRQAYYFVLDDLKVPVPRSERDAEAVKDIVLEVGEGILAQSFEPTPSPQACSMCDYRIACPAAEA